MNYEDLSSELRAQVNKCTSADELVSLAKSMGYALNDKELDVIAGGGWLGGSGDYSKCPNCGSTAIDKDPGGTHCMDCGETWY